MIPFNLHRLVDAAASAENCEQRICDLIDFTEICGHWHVALDIQNLAGNLFSFLILVLRGEVCR